MELTDANGGKIHMDFNPLVWYRLLKTKYLHDCDMNFTINTTTFVMMKFHLN